jgi:hypothetical protein
VPRAGASGCSLRPCGTVLCTGRRAAVRWRRTPGYATGTDLPCGTTFGWVGLAIQQTWTRWRPGDRTGSRGAGDRGAGRSGRAHRAVLGALPLARPAAGLLLDDVASCEDVVQRRTSDAPLLAPARRPGQCGRLPAPDRGQPVAVGPAPPAGRAAARAESRCRTARVPTDEGATPRSSATQSYVRSGPFEAQREAVVLRYYGDLTEARPPTSWLRRRVRSRRTRPAASRARRSAQGDPRMIDTAPHRAERAAPPAR